MTTMNKKIYIIISGIILILVIIIVALFLSSNRNVDPEFTGGSGRPQVGRLILTGYNTTSNDPSKIPVGSFLTSKQQSNIRSSIEKILFKTDAKKEYVGSIKLGTVDIDDDTSVVSFVVEINDPKSTYKISYNTVSNEMDIYDSKGNKIAD